MEQSSLGQLLLVGVPGLELDSETARLYRQIQPGGFILFGRNIRSASQLRKLSHKPDHLKIERAFVGGQSDDLAESLGEQVIESATSGEYDGEDVANQDVTEEQGGPFVESSGAREFGHDIDESNPVDAKREPFPTS